MINEEKVILMTHASLYENGEGKKQMKIADYYRHDYISVRLLLGWFWERLVLLPCWHYGSSTKWNT